MNLNFIWKAIVLDEFLYNLQIPFHNTIYRIILKSSSVHKKTGSLIS